MLADDECVQVLVCNRCRVVVNFKAECLAGEPIAELRRQAAAKAVELALERRIPLNCVFEMKTRYRW